MIGQIAIAVEPLSPMDVGEIAFARFNQCPQLCALPIVDEAGIPVGLLTRSRFFRAFGDIWGRPLYEHRPISLLMDKDPLMVDCDTPLAMFGNAIVDQQQFGLLEGFIVTRGGRYLGLGDGMGLLRGTLAASQSMSLRTSRLQSDLEHLLHARTAHEGQVDAFVAQVLQTLAQALQIEAISIWRFSGAEAARCVGAFCLAGDQFGIDQPVSLQKFPIYQTALARSRVLIAPDASAHPAFQDMLEARLLSPLGLSFLHAQIGAGANAKGFLCCESRSRARDWFAEEASFCASVAELLGLAFAAEELELARKGAETASREKSAFLANMSHELRTPLNAIIGFSELLLEDAENAGHAQYVADQRRVLNASVHLLKVINEVLDLSKVEAGKLTIEFASQDPAALALAAAEQVRALVERGGNRLVMDTTHAPCLAQLDGLRVTQCLLNLLSNAAKFTQDGEILLRVAQEEIQGRGRWLVFQVQDTGIGMNEEQAARVFQPFMQADFSIARRFGGTGLGLSLSRRLANLMGGDVTLISALGQGSCFCLRLPLHTGESQGVRAA
jgi:signal transduction histidine kinase